MSLFRVVNGGATLVAGLAVALPLYSSGTATGRNVVATEFTIVGDRIVGAYGFEQSSTTPKTSWVHLMCSDAGPTTSAAQAGALSA